MPESPFTPDEPSNDSAEDLTPGGERSDDRGSDLPGGEQRSSAAAPDTPAARGEAPDTDRLGYREQDEQRAYSEHGHQGTAGHDA